MGRGMEELNKIEKYVKEGEVWAFRSMAFRIEANELLKEIEPYKKELLEISGALYVIKLIEELKRSKNNAHSTSFSPSQIKEILKSISNDGIFTGSLATEIASKFIQKEKEIEGEKEIDFYKKELIENAREFFGKIKNSKEQKKGKTQKANRIRR